MFLINLEKKQIQRWLQRLVNYNSSYDELKLRNDYVWFLLVQLESGQITIPFVNSPPKTGPLPSITESVVTKSFTYSSVQ